MSNFLTLDDMTLSTGKRARLYRLLYGHGPGNGTALFLPIDQGLEHGPVDFFPNPPSKDPAFQCELALRGGYTGLVFQIGLAEKYMHAYAGRVPLVLKLNGKTTIPSDAEAFSPQCATVEDAVRLGADAVGYTLYVGSPAQADDFQQFADLRAEAEALGMPVIVWAYPRGSAIEEKGGRDSIYAVDYAARTACELGADVVKINLPKLDNLANLPKPYNTLADDEAAAVRRVVESAGRTLVLFSGGSKLGDDDLMAKAHLCMGAGATGLIFGRNMWQRPMDEALAITARIKTEVMSQYSRELRSV
ncbi:MAG: fructose-bisphosphate aldolase [Armatimonadetes bacterium]|nr:fructose-bisphosphate aldolase [Armatimonadota bacterium]